MAAEPASSPRFWTSRLCFSKANPKLDSKEVCFLVDLFEPLISREVECVQDALLQQSHLLEITLLTTADEKSSLKRHFWHFVDPTGKAVEACKSSDLSVKGSRTLSTLSPVVLLFNVFSPKLFVLYLPKAGKICAVAKNAVVPLHFQSCSDRYLDHFG